MVSETDYDRVVTAKESGGHKIYIKKSEPKKETKKSDSEKSYSSKAEAKKASGNGVKKMSHGWVPTKPKITEKVVGVSKAPSIPQTLPEGAKRIAGGRVKYKGLIYDEKTLLEMQAGGQQLGVYAAKDIEEREYQSVKGWYDEVVVEEERKYPVYADPSGFVYAPIEYFPGEKFVDTRVKPVGTEKVPIAEMYLEGPDILRVYPGGDLPGGPVESIIKEAKEARRIVTREGDIITTRKPIRAISTPSEQAKHIEKALGAALEEGAVYAPIESYFGEGAQSFKYGTGEFDVVRVPDVEDVFIMKEGKKAPLTPLITTFDIGTGEIVKKEYVLPLSNRAYEEHLFKTQYPDEYKEWLAYSASRAKDPYGIRQVSGQAFTEEEYTKFAAYEDMVGSITRTDIALEEGARKAYGSDWKEPKEGLIFPETIVRGLAGGIGRGSLGSTQILSRAFFMGKSSMGGAAEYMLGDPKVAEAKMIAPMEFFKAHPVETAIGIAAVAVPGVGMALGGAIGGTAGAGVAYGTLGATLGAFGVVGTMEEMERGYSLPEAALISGATLGTFVILGEGAIMGARRGGAMARAWAKPKPTEYALPIGQFEIAVAKKAHIPDAKPPFDVNLLKKPDIVFEQAAYPYRFEGVLPKVPGESGVYPTPKFIEEGPVAFDASKFFELPKPKKQPTSGISRLEEAPAMFDISQFVKIPKPPKEAGGFARFEDLPLVDVSKYVKLPKDTIPAALRDIYGPVPKYPKGSLVTELIKPDITIQFVPKAKGTTTSFFEFPTEPKGFRKLEDAPALFDVSQFVEIKPMGKPKPQIEGFGKLDEAPTAFDASDYVNLWGKPTKEIKPISPSAKKIIDASTLFKPLKPPKGGTPIDVGQGARQILITEVKPLPKTVTEIQTMLKTKPKAKPLTEVMVESITGIKTKTGTKIIPLMIPLSRTTELAKEKEITKTLLIPKVRVVSIPKATTKTAQRLYLPPILKTSIHTMPLTKQPTGIKVMTAPISIPITPTPPPIIPKPPAPPKIPIPITPKKITEKPPPEKPFALLLPQLGIQTQKGLGLSKMKPQPFKYKPSLIGTGFVPGLPGFTIKKVPKIVTGGGIRGMLEPEDKKKKKKKKKMWWFA